MLLKQLNLPSDFGLSFVVSFNLTLQALVKPDAIVEKNFSEALELSRNQSAKVFELRAAGDLARLWQKQGKTNEAYQLLNGVYNWLTEGFDSVDLKEAREILDELIVKKWV